MNKNRNNFLRYFLNTVKLKHCEIVQNFEEKKMFFILKSLCYFDNKILAIWDRKNLFLNNNNL